MSIDNLDPLAPRDYSWARIVTDKDVLDGTANLDHYFVKEEDPLRHFLDKILPYLPNHLVSRQEMLRSILKNWSEIERVHPVKQSRTVLIVGSNSKPQVSIKTRFKDNLPLLTNLALRVISERPEWLVPINAPYYSICKYPPKTFIRYMINGEFVLIDIGYTYLLILHESQDSIILESPIVIDPSLEA